MFGLEEIADWWDGQKQESEQILQEWVNDSESDFGLYGRALIATGFSTAMILGGGMVDVLRIGEGVKEGGWGYGKDALRLLVLAGPILRLGRLAAAKWTYNPPGGLCASVTAAKALRQTGTRLFVSAQSLFTRAGKTAPKNLNEFLPMLRSLGAKVKELPFNQLNQLNSYTGSIPKSVIMFGVRWNMPGKGIVGHALYAFRNSLGQFRIADRTGKIVGSLMELEVFYPGISRAVPQGSALLVKNAIIIEGTSLASLIALEVNAVLVKNNDETKELQLFPVTDE